MTRHWSEGLAKGYLERLGYRILAENYNLRGGEIDLIAQDGVVLVFVEVKQRSSNRFGSPAEGISRTKLKRLQRAALYYTVTTYGRDDLPMRFDALLYSGSQKQHTVEHLKNIF